jgi:membrane-associated protease RseP (regulator of RpoE activity)
MMHAGPVQNRDFNSFLQAQALWDETMAESVAQYLAANPDMRMVVIAGRGHTHKTTAIPPRVFRRLSVQQAVVVNVEAGVEADPDAADYLFFSPPAALPPAPLLGVMLKETENETGAQIADLSPQGQAQEAGIKKGDIIIAIDGDPVQDVEDVKIAMAFKEGRESVRVRVKRARVLLADEELEFEVGLKSNISPHS